MACSSTGRWISAASLPGRQGSKLPDYVVLISTLGGIEVFGLNGFVIGPLIAAMFMVSWEIFAVSRRADAAGGTDMNP